MIDSDELIDRALDTLKASPVCTFLNDAALRELAQTVALFAAQFASEAITELRVEP